MERQGIARNGDVEIAWTALGDPNSHPIVMLHGFPEFNAAWRKVAERLADRFSCIMPDQRGYGGSSKPADADAYRSGKLAADVAALVDSVLPGRDYSLAGHDWGASVAYAHAFRRPPRLKNLIIANGIHPACFQRAIFDDPEQRAASQYINRLREPGMEDRLAEDGFRRLTRMFEGFSATDWMSADEADAYRAAWARPGALKAMLDWYRSSPVDVPEPDAQTPHSRLLDAGPEVMTVAVPHLVVWGSNDTALRPSCLDGLHRYAPVLTIAKLPGAGHWILHEQPDIVAAWIDRFVSFGHK